MCLAFPLYVDHYDLNDNPRLVVNLLLNQSSFLEYEPELKVPDSPRLKSVASDVYGEINEQIRARNAARKETGPNIMAHHDRTSSEAGLQRGLSIFARTFSQEHAKVMAGHHLQFARFYRLSGQHRPATLNLQRAHDWICQVRLREPVFPLPRRLTRKTKERGLTGRGECSHSDPFSSRSQ